MTGQIERSEVAISNLKPGMELDKNCFNVEALYSRVGVLVEKFDGMIPAKVDLEYITEYILDLRKYLAEGDVSPSQIVLHEGGRVELLFYPINADTLNEKA